MKKPIRKAPTTPVRRQESSADDVLDEYDFTNARKNPYSGRVTTGGMVVVVDADLVTAFPTTEAVNDALRVIAAAAARIQSLKADGHSA